jgi:hypothetical protein
MKKLTNEIIENKASELAEKIFDMAYDLLRDMHISKVKNLKKEEALKLEIMMETLLFGIYYLNTYSTD